MTVANFGQSQEALTLDVDRSEIHSREFASSQFDAPVGFLRDVPWDPQGMQFDLPQQYERAMFPTAAGSSLPTVGGESASANFSAPNFQAGTIATVAAFEPIPGPPTPQARFASFAQNDRLMPNVLRPPAEDLPPLAAPPMEDPFVRWPIDPPTGYTGPSGVAPSEFQESGHFIPMEDRWRSGYPEWDRYQGALPPGGEAPFVEGHWYDPYHQNVLKGDYAILGQNNFLILTLSDQLILEGRQVPTPNTPFESTPEPNRNDFFGDPDQFFLVNNTILSIDWVHGDGAFKPVDWRFKATPIFNMNNLAVGELGVVNPDVREGRTRFRTDFALEDWFMEAKLCDIGPDYDFMSVRAGSQFFNSDFKGFIFSDTNRAVRLFGTARANRDQFNIVYVDQTEKDTNSLLNTFVDRNQNTLIANYYYQDLIWPGYTAGLSYHYNDDGPSFKFDNNGFLVRPDPIGVFAPHRVVSHYLGWTGQGHINRFNVSHALYYAFGEDDLNPIAGKPQDISAFMFAGELSYDRDWIRFRTSYFYSSGDDDPNDNNARGFDTIFDNPNFAGGQFSYWQRQQIKLFGVNLVQRQSLVPDLRSSKFQGQTNFVNPGLHLVNAGFDIEYTPKIRSINNVNLLWFDQTEVLETVAFQGGIRNFIGTDVSTGFEYRPLLNNNIIFLAGISALIPGDGFKDLYNPIAGNVDTLFGSFGEMIVTY